MTSNANRRYHDSNYILVLQDFITEPWIRPQIEIAQNYNLIERENKFHDSNFLYNNDNLRNKRYPATPYTDTEPMIELIVISPETVQQTPVLCWIYASPRLFITAVLWCTNRTASQLIVLKVRISRPLTKESGAQTTRQSSFIIHCIQYQETIDN